MIGHADEVVLARLVGTATFGRGKEYAHRGLVLKLLWSEGGTRVVGEVQGGAPGSYYVSARLTRSPAGQLTSFQSTCTCPVGINCKHGVALVMAEDQAAPSHRTPELTLVKGGGGPGRRPKGTPGDRGRRTSRRDPGVADWENSLQSLMGADEQATDEVDREQIGLQFELVLAPAKAAHGAKAHEPTIRIRPVMPGRKDNWIRSGISWSNIDYLAGGRGRVRQATEQLLVIKELLALSRLASRRSYYSYNDDMVSLEAINSRRLWDLLGEARDLRLPMVQAGRHAQPVTLHRSTAAPALDVTRSDAALRLRPRIAIDDHDIELASSLLIGSPAHGIAWWNDRSPAATEAPRLELAALDQPMDDSLRDFLGTTTVQVPAEQEHRFLGTFLPTLRRKLAVTSSDHSVDLPEDRPATLVLSVHYLDGHRLRLNWWRGIEGSEWREGLWESRSGFHDRPSEDVLVAAVTGVTGSVADLFERTPFGERLAAEAELAGMAAVRFVTELLPLLSELAGVEIEQIGTAPDYREEVEAPVVSLGGSESTQSDWFDLTVSVTVSGEEVPFADLFVALAEDQSHLILPSGTYFSLDRRELRELAQLIAEARSLLDASGDSVRLSRFQASLWEDLQRLGVITAQAGTWEASVRSLSGASDLTEYPAPESLKAELRPYQHQGFNWLAYLYEHRLGGVLADDMGLGKTLEALALMCHTRERGLTDAPYLVVAPTSVVGNWAAECRRFAPGLEVTTVAETSGRRGTTLAQMAEASDLVVTSYSLFRLEYEEYAAVAWAGLFLDEAQFAKNRRSQTYQRAKLLPVPFKVAMTGTPIENNLMELWSLLSITAPGLFPSPERFGEYYRKPIERQGDVERLDQLRRRVRPLMLRRTKEQVAGDLPDKQESILELDLNPRHKRIYQTHLQRERQKVLGLLGDMKKNRFAIFTSLTLLRQASLDVSLIDAKYEGVPSTKLDALMEMLEDIVEDGHRVLVFSQFTRFLGLARDRIRAEGIDHCYLDGRTKKREAVIDEFRSGTAPVFLISLKAGGFGLNLTEADYCILLDPWWNPATEAQAVDRVHRIGQTRKVMVYRLVAKDTLEEKVMALKAKKSALFSDVMDAGGFESGALTAEDIAGLLD